MSGPEIDRAPEFLMNSSLEWTMEGGSAAFCHGALAVRLLNGFERHRAIIGSSSSSSSGGTYYC